MREFERIQRMMDLLSQLWTYDHTASFGELLEKWIWSDWIGSPGDIFHPEDSETEKRIREAITKVQSSSSPVSVLTKRQQDVIKKIEELWSHVPDQRLGQFLSNYAFGHLLSHPPKMQLRQTDEAILQALEQCHSQ